MTEAKKNTQPDRVLAHLKTGARLTPLEAWKQFGIQRLADPVHKLRGKGHDIRMEMVPACNQLGEPCEVAVYWLVDSAPKAMPVEQPSLLEAATC